MAIRTTRRQVVLDAAAIGAIYAAGWGQSPAPVAAAPAPVAAVAVAPPPPPTPSPVAATVATLARLLADVEARIQTAAPGEREHLAVQLECVEAQCRFMVAGLDGSMVRYLSTGVRSTAPQA